MGSVGPQSSSSVHGAYFGVQQNVGQSGMVAERGQRSRQTLHEESAWMQSLASAMSSAGTTPRDSRTSSATGRMLPHVPVGRHRSRGTIQRSSSPRPRSRPGQTLPQQEYEQEQNFSEFVLRLERIENSQRYNAQNIARDTQQMDEMRNMMMDDRQKLNLVCDNIEELLGRMNMLAGGLGKNVLAPIKKLEEVANSHHVGLHELHQDLQALKAGTHDQGMRQDAKMNALIEMSHAIKGRIEGMLGSKSAPTMSPQITKIRHCPDPIRRLHCLDRSVHYAARGGCMGHWK